MGVIYNDTESNGEKFADYVEFALSNWVTSEATVFFNLKILVVLFKGYSDQDEERFIEYIKWEKDTPFKYKKA